MQKEILLEILKRNRFNCYHTFKDINTENERFRLNEKTASVGYIYRHIGEYLSALEMSRKIMDQGFNSLENLIESASDEAWLEKIDTPFFGNISRIELFSVILFHNSHHCGQIASAIVKGNEN